MNPVNFEINGESYQLLPHTGFEAIDLDRKVLGVIGRMARNGGMLDDDMGAFAALSDTLSEMPSSDYHWLVQTTLKTVTVTTAGKKNVTLSDADAIAGHFAGRMNDLYTVMLRVWKEEKLSPFAVAPKNQDGGSTEQTQS